MQFDLKNAIEVLERTPASLQALVSGLNEEWTNVNEGEGSWSVMEVVAHLIYLDKMNWLHRAKQLMTTGAVVRFDPLNRTGGKSLSDELTMTELLNSFQQTANEYNMDHDLIGAFFHSMEMDLNQIKYDTGNFNEYVYGSAEVVGLMCLYVFCEGRKELYDNLKMSARSLGAAFQKVNFLRDMKADYNDLCRMYFPGCDFNNFTEKDKKQIEDDIYKDFRTAYAGILKLPLKSRFGVYVAYKYYLSLFKKIKSLQPARVFEERIRIPDYEKAMIVLRAGVKNHLGLIG